MNNPVDNRCYISLMSEKRVYDVAFSQVKNTNATPYYRINLPCELTESLEERGYNRAIIVLAEEGILLKPYDYTKEKKAEQVNLPDWD